MFLTPAGEPFWGGTYFPPEVALRPARLPRGARDRRPDLARGARQGREQHDRAQATRSPGSRRRRRPDALSPAFAAADRAAPGAGVRYRSTAALRGAPKFPQAPVLDLLWRQALATRRSPRAATRSCTRCVNICQGGIYDHLGGGFARYSVDAPVAGAAFREDALRQRPAARAAGRRCGRHRQSAVRGARRRDGRLARAGDAGRRTPSRPASMPTARARRAGSTSGTRPRSTACSGPTRAAFRLAYGVTDGGNWEGKTSSTACISPASARRRRRRRCGSSADLLLAARDAAGPPGRDDKVLADWNGLTIAALARASAVFGRPDWLDARRGGVRLRLPEHDQRRPARPQLARAARGSISPSSTTMRRWPRPRSACSSTPPQAGLSRARARMGRAARCRLPRPCGRLLPGCRPTPPTCWCARRTPRTGPTPAANGAARVGLARLHALTGDDAYRRARRAAARGVLRRGPPQSRGPLRRCSAAMRSSRGPIQVVLIGRRATIRGLARLRRTALGRGGARSDRADRAARTVARRRHPAAGKIWSTVARPPTSAPDSLLPPITEPDQLADSSRRRASVD